MLTVMCTVMDMVERLSQLKKDYRSQGYDNHTNWGEKLNLKLHIKMILITLLYIL